MEGVQELAAFIASKSPVAVHGTKQLLLHARDNRVDEALEAYRRHAKGEPEGERDAQAGCKAGASAGISAICSGSK